MKKIRLDPDTLSVESFDATVGRGARGTVHARDSWQAYCTLGATCSETACAYESDYWTSCTACRTDATHCSPCSDFC